MATSRIRVLITGRVQGVGFRPFVCREAMKRRLSGFVRNITSGVEAEAQGSPAGLDSFAACLRADAPPQAHIENVAITRIEPREEEPPFAILKSHRSGDVTAGMPPDLAVCRNCLGDIFESTNRRFRYPFTNCTNCGPRFTIIRALPYDRERTSMSSFTQCPACLAEYRDPADRRFDAQPNACPVCGPSIRLITPSGKDVESSAVTTAAGLLEGGAILAIKGLGGYHLACRADQDTTIARLRERKHRPAKSFAVMFASISEIRTHCHVTDAEERAIGSVASPIVVVRLRTDSGLSRLVSPDTNDVGVFMPYTPLHSLLLSEISPLVMTSGNRSEEPLVADETELARILGPIADYALVHNRPIARRCDDSVVKWSSSGPIVLRRSRGFVPDRILLPVSGPPVLACGAESKNTFCITRGRDAFLSQHVGDLSALAAYKFWLEAVGDLKALLEIEPEIVAHDLHPDFPSTRYAQRLGDRPLLAVQHHHAHIAACMAEHGLRDPLIGVALDGTGYGPDGTIWGGEFLVADLKGYRRVGHFKPYRLPGGGQAIANPERMALSCLVAEFGAADADRHAAALLPGLTPGEREVLTHMIGRGVRSPWTSSAGRLFDAVSALLGACTRASYEGQASIRLQAAVSEGVSACYPFRIYCADRVHIPDFGDTLRTIVDDRAKGRPRGFMAAAFHNTVAAAIVETCRKIRDDNRLTEVALSGGVFQNEVLLELVIEGLCNEGFKVYNPKCVPPNDGGISLGQAAVALAVHGDANC